MRIPILLLLGCILIIGCTNAENMAVSPPIALQATPNLLPTPTLAPGIPTNPPPTPILTPLAGNSAVSLEPQPTQPPATQTPNTTPTATPLPEERLEIGQNAIAEGDFDLAAEQFSASLGQPEALTAEQQTEALYNLGVAYLQNGRFSEAASSFNQLLSQNAAAPYPATAFYLAQAYTGMADHQGAIASYQTYLQNNPEMAAYIQPLIAASYLVLGDRPNAALAYEAALAGPAHRLTYVDIRRKLAELYLVDANYAAAIAQYDAIHALAITENTKGEMTYLAGTAEIAAGNLAAGYARYQTGITNYPRAYESYLGLVALVDAGQPVDEYQRGVVDFFAEAYQPAIEAFTRYLAAATAETIKTDTYLYLAWSYEAVGDLPNALTALATYAQSEPATATIEQAHLLARAGQTTEAINSYLAYTASYPDGTEAPAALWWAAELTEGLGDVNTAVSYYQQLAVAYPWHEDAPLALFYAGWLVYHNGDTNTAVSIWHTLYQTYPTHEYGAAALVWLQKILPGLPDPSPAPTQTPTITPTLAAGQVDDSTPFLLNETPPLSYTELLTMVQQAAQNGRQTNYYALRARDIANNTPPFPQNVPFDLTLSPTAQAEAETWLRNWLGLDAATDVGQLSAELAAEPRLVVGGKLWQLGLFEQAKRELEGVRADHAENALYSYQLALYFRDLGVYRSSILAASTVIGLSGQSIFDIPPFIGRLAYPTYYADLVVPLAEQYGYNPLLQFSLVRQESLFESFARSGAAAQGLSQVIPSTGAYIAEQLAWPNYTNDELYKPHVGLAFGAYYLDEQLRLFDEFVPAALAAYNGGPGNAARWHGAAGDDLDLFVETVTFWETRLYIERIYVGYVIYQFLYS